MKDGEEIRDARLEPWKFHISARKTHATMIVNDDASEGRE
jgi:hypothetical protein